MIFDISIVALKMPKSYPKWTKRSVMLTIITKLVNANTSSCSVTLICLTISVHRIDFDFVHYATQKTKHKQKKKMMFSSVAINCQTLF